MKMRASREKMCLFLHAPTPQRSPDGPDKFESTSTGSREGLIDISENEGREEAEEFLHKQ